jgi:formylglycine-generating enzyme
MQPINPYIAGDPVGNSPAFVGREDILRDVLKVLRNPNQNAITLYGQRRIGKTSMLQYLQAHLKEAGDFRAVYFDLQYKASWSLPRILVDLAQTIAEQLSLPIPEFPLEETGIFRGWLEDVLEHIPSETCIILLLDEFDVLTDPPSVSAIEFFPYLRKLELAKLKFVFVLGRNIDDLSSIALSVFKGINSKRISLMNQDDTNKLLRLSERNQTLLWTDASAKAVWDLTHGHPFLTQSLCQQIWEIIYDKALQETPTVTTEIVAEAVDDALEASNQALKWLWDGLGPAEKVVSAALAEAGNVTVDEAQLEHILRESGVRILIRELQNVPELLRDWDILEPADGGYVFRVEMLRRWITYSHPLRRTLDELDRIVPTADSLFQAARGFYEQSKLDDAEHLLRQALGLNPNHLRAHELLAELLIASGHLDDARSQLERLVELAPNIARPRLMQIYLEQARAAPDDKTRRTLYEKVLKLDSTSIEARTEIERIKKSEQEAMELLTTFMNGREALRRSEWDRAIELFQRIVAKNPAYSDDDETAADLLAQAVRKKEERSPIWLIWLKQPRTWIRSGYISILVLMGFLVFGIGQSLVTVGATRGQGPFSWLAPTLPAIIRTHVVTVVITVTPKPIVTRAPIVTLISTDASTPPIEHVRSKDGMPIIFIKGNTFKMGSLEGVVAADSDEKPVHDVSLDSFWMDKTEVTNQMFVTFLNSFKDDANFQIKNGYVYFQKNKLYYLLDTANFSNRINWDNKNFLLGNKDYAEHPVVDVTWYGANEYCKWTGAHLPTEAQWEYAARSTDERQYPWGNIWDCKKVNSNGSSCDGFPELAPVGSFSGDKDADDDKRNGDSPFGVSDMAGNVWEWVNDWYDLDYYKQRTFVNPAGPGDPINPNDQNNMQRVLRGGSWSSVDANLRTTDRLMAMPDESNSLYGFRCARPQP